MTRKTHCTNFVHLALNENRPCHSIYDSYMAANKEAHKKLERVKDRKRRKVKSLTFWPSRGLPTEAWGDPISCNGRKKEVKTNNRNNNLKRVLGCFFFLREILFNIVKPFCFSTDIRVYLIFKTLIWRQHLETEAVEIKYNGLYQMTFFVVTGEHFRFFID